MKWIKWSIVWISIPISRGENSRWTSDISDRINKSLVIYVDKFSKMSDIKKKDKCPRKSRLIRLISKET